MLGVAECVTESGFPAGAPSGDRRIRIMQLGNEVTVPIQGVPGTKCHSNVRFAKIAASLWTLP